MCMNKKVSVIVPVYNLESYIERCLDSLLMQDYDDLEIILVNDGSTDKSLEIIEKYAQQSESIIVINQKNSGVSSARNAGIEKATGFFIAFVDGDDYIDSNYYELLLKKITSDNYDFVQMGFICEHGNGKREVAIQEAESYDIRGKQEAVFFEGVWDPIC